MTTNNQHQLNQREAKVKDGPKEDIKIDEGGKIHESNFF
jgi:hypothetical protein